MTVMLVAIVLPARRITRRFDAGRTAPAWLVVGLVALALLLVADLVLGVALRGASPKEALMNRDPVSGGAYYAALCVFAIRPWPLERFGRRTPKDGPPVGQSRGQGADKHNASNMLANRDRSETPALA